MTNHRRRRRRRHPIPGLLALVTVLTGAASPHGIDVVVDTDGPFRVVIATYASGDPAADADVTVGAPEAYGQGEPWQQGRTDPRGRFVFAPDRPGEWRVVVDDGQGHRAVASVVVPAPSAVETIDTSVADGVPAPAATRSGAPAPREGGTTVWQLATGLALIAGVTGVAYGVAGRR
jgi:nickel transport protein